MVLISMEIKCKHKDNCISYTYKCDRCKKNANHKKDYFEGDEVYTWPQPYTAPYTIPYKWYPDRIIYTCENTENSGTYVCATTTTGTKGDHYEKG